MDNKQKEREYNFLSNVLYLLANARLPIDENESTVYMYKLAVVTEEVYNRRDQLDQDEA